MASFYCGDTNSTPVICGIHTVLQLRGKLAKLYITKSLGPDGITRLKEAQKDLHEHMETLSLKIIQEGKIPAAYKTAEVEAIYQESGTGTSDQADTVEEVGLDGTHPQEASIQHHTPSPDLEPAGEEEERLAS